MAHHLHIQILRDGLKLRELGFKVSPTLRRQWMARIFGDQLSPDKEISALLETGDTEKELHRLLNAVLQPYSMKQPTLIVEMGVSKSYMGVVGLPTKLSDVATPAFAAKWAEKTWGVDTREYELRHVIAKNGRGEAELIVGLLRKSVVVTARAVCERLSITEPIFESCLPRVFNWLGSAPDGTVVCVGEQLSGGIPFPMYQLFGRFSGHTVCARHFSHDATDLELAAKRLAFAHGETSVQHMHRWYWNGEYGLLQGSKAPWL